MDILRKFSTKTFVKFLVVSAIGAFLFITPIKFNGEWTIPVAIIVSAFQAVTANVFSTILVGIIAISTSLSLLNKCFGIFKKSKVLSELFETSWLWLIIRCIGAVFAVMVFLKIGPEIVLSSETGANMLYGLVPTVSAWFVVTGLLIAMLTDYGLMEFCGTLLRRISSFLFKVPGRAAICCITSWVGSGVCGAVLITGQYDSGYFTGKEAAISITNFAVVSVAFCQFIAQYLGIAKIFVPFYLTITLCGVVCAIITPRIWPLCKIKDTYAEGIGKQINEDVPENSSNLEWGLQLALEKAEQAPKLIPFIKKGVKGAANLLISMPPVIMAVGTLTLILSTYTPVFEIISYPFQFILGWLQIPYAVEAAPAMIVGFADMFIPLVIGETIPSEITRFIIGCISVTQLVYMTDIGSIILTSKIPLDLKSLFVIFIERTFIILPIATIMANIIF